MGGFWFTRKFFAFGFQSGIFHNFKNYFEPRTSDFSQFWDSPNGMYIEPFISTDYSKALALDVNINSQYYLNNTRRSNTITIAPRWQINSRCLIIARSRLGIIRGREGYIDKSGFDYASYGLTLDDDGNSIYTINNNFFNVDLNYYWRFLPGSDIIFSYKNNAFANELLDGYADNLSSLFQERSNHFYSLKVLYFLDVNRTVQSLSERR